MAKYINDDLQVTIAPFSYAAAESNTPGNSYVESATLGLNLADNTEIYAPFSLSSNQYVYYTFNVNFIPDGAQIQEVSAVVRAHTNSGNISVLIGYFTNDFGVSPRSWNNMSNSVTIGSDTETVSITTYSGWTKEILSRTDLRFSGSNVSFNFYGCSFTIRYTYQGTIYEVNTENLTDLISEIYPEGLTDVYPENHQDEYTFTMVGDSLDGIIVEDEVITGGSSTIYDVTLDVQEYQSTIGYMTRTATASSATLNGLAWISPKDSGSNDFKQDTSLYKQAVGRLASQTSVNTSKYLFRRSAQPYDSYIDYKFDFSDILFTSKIIDVSVSVRGRAQLVTGYDSIANVRLWSGDIPKSETINFTNKSDNIITFGYTGTWTAEDLQNAFVRFTFGISGGYVGGISWRVNYIVEPDFPKYWIYTLPSVLNDHNITVRKADDYNVRTYDIDTIVYYINAVEVSNTHRILRRGDTYNLTIYTTDIAHTRLLDNEVDYTDSIALLSNEANAYTYTITNVTKNHVIKIVEFTNYAISSISLAADVDVTVSTNKVYAGDSFAITLTTNSISNIFIYDNDNDITSQFIRSGNTYIATINNVQEDHDIVVVEKTKKVLTVLSNSENINISPNGYMSVLEGDSQVLTIKTGANTFSFNGTMFNNPKKVVPRQNIILKDNDINVSAEMVEVAENMYTYTVSNINEAHTIVVYELFVPEYEDPEYTYYSLSITSLNAITTPITGTTRVVEGTNTTVNIIPSEPVIITCTDNGEDITGQFEKIFFDDIYIAADPSYTIQDKTSTYKFIMNNNTGYYTSNNKSIPNSQVVARINFVLPVSCNIEIEYINYAEEGGDYGIFGLIDVSLNASNSAYVDTNVYQSCAAKDSNNDYMYNKPYSQTVTYFMEAGEHFIDIKYLKNSNSYHKNNDTLEWKISAINPTRSYVYYNYTVENINQDHSLVFVFGDRAYYTLQSSGTNSRLFPNGVMIRRQDEPYSLTIIPNIDLFKLILKDNGIDKSVNIVKIESVIDNENIVNYIYTIKRVNDNHVIEVLCKSPYDFFLKYNNEWETIQTVYKKIDGEWKILYDYAEFINNPNTVRIFKENIDN